MSVSIEPELVPFRHVLAMWVDPIEVGHCGLLDLVRGLGMTTPQLPIRHRWISPARRVTLNELVATVADGPPLLRLLGRRADLSDETRKWAAAVEARGLQWQFERWANYLAAGTLEVSGTVPVPTHRVAAARRLRVQ